MKKEERFLDVGLIVFLEPKGVNKNIRYKSSLVGWKKDGVIIIDTPFLNGAYISLSVGCNCIVRYIYHGQAFGFETKVLKNINDPNFPLVYLTYPGEIYKISLREHARSQTYIPVKMQILIQWQSEGLDGHILDLSVGGCLLEFITYDNLNIKLGDEIKISFSLPGMTDQIIGIRCIIRRMQTIRDNTKIGVQFINVSDDILIKIRSFNTPAF